MAPALKSGMAIMSIFGRGYFTLNVFSKNFNTFGPTNFAYSTCWIHIHSFYGYRLVYIYIIYAFLCCYCFFLRRHSFTWDIASRLAHILNTTSPSAGDSLNSKSLIVYATRYVDIGTVTSNLSSTQSVLFILNIGWRSRMCKNYINFALKGYKWMNDKYVHWFGGDFWHITQSRKIFVVT